MKASPPPGNWRSATACFMSRESRNLDNDPTGLAQGPKARSHEDYKNYLCVFVSLCLRDLRDYPSSRGELASAGEMPPAINRDGLPRDPPRPASPTQRPHPPDLFALTPPPH